jgi:hypothetical protein
MAMNHIGKGDRYVREQPKPADSRPPPAGVYELAHLIRIQQISEIDSRRCSEVLKTPSSSIHDQELVLTVSVIALIFHFYHAVVLNCF